MYSVYFCSGAGDLFSLITTDTYIKPSLLYSVTTWLGDRVMAAAQSNQGDHVTALIRTNTGHIISWIYLPAMYGGLVCVFSSQYFSQVLHAYICLLGRRALPHPFR